MALYKSTPETTTAYYTDGTHKWFGSAPKGCALAAAGWSIFKMEYTGSNWVIKFPVDPDTGKATDAPKFIWGTTGATAAAYTFNILGT